MKEKENPTIQVRLHIDVIKKVEQRALALGYIKPSGDANISDYVRNLIIRDISNSHEILDGDNTHYDV